MQRRRRNLINKWHMSSYLHLIEIIHCSFVKLAERDVKYFNSALTVNLMCNIWKIPNKNNCAKDFGVNFNILSTYLNEFIYDCCQNIKISSTLILKVVTGNYYEFKALIHASQNQHHVVHISFITLLWYINISRI